MPATGVPVCAFLGAKDQAVMCLNGEARGHKAPQFRGELGCVGLQIGGCCSDCDLKTLRRQRVFSFVSVLNLASASCDLEALRRQSVSSPVSVQPCIRELRPQGSAQAQANQLCSCPMLHQGRPSGSRGPHHGLLPSWKAWK